MTQMGEWKYGYECCRPCLPTNLAITNTSFNSVALSWKDNATSESSFQVERSEDGIIFSAAGTAAAQCNVLHGSKPVWGNLILLPGAALSSTAGMSVPSNVVSTTTLWDPALHYRQENLTAVLPPFRYCTDLDDKSANEDGLNRTLGGWGSLYPNSYGRSQCDHVYQHRAVKATKYYFVSLRTIPPLVLLHQYLLRPLPRGKHGADIKAGQRHNSMQQSVGYKILLRHNPGYASESYQEKWSWGR